MTSSPLSSPGPARSRYANVVFDLDGTLVDSLPGIEISLRAALAVHHPGLDLPATGIRHLIGPPLPQIVRACWPQFDDQEVADMVAAYRVHYLAESCATTEAFPGTAELLAELHAAKVRLFVLTNKPLAQTEMILKRQGWTAFFVSVACPDHPEHPFSRKEEGVLGLRERCGLAPERTLLVGDAADDARAAEAAGFAFAAAGYGYGNLGRHGSSLEEDQTVIGSVADLRPLIFSESSFPPSHDHSEPLR